MAYTKQTFEDRVVDAAGNVTTEGTVLTAEHLNHIEDGIAAAEIECPQIYNHTPQKKASGDPIRILCFGSSWFLNTWFYLNKITNNLGINAEIHGYYMGHSQFNEWIAFYNGEVTPFAGSESTRQAYRYVSENGADYTYQAHSTGGSFGDQEYRDAWYNDLIAGDWDIIAFQQGAHQSVKWEYWENYNVLLSYIKRHCNPNTVIAFNNTWCPSVTNQYLPGDTDGACDNTVEGQKLWQTMNFNNCKRLMNLSGIRNVSPNGAMIYTMRRDETLNTDSYDLMYDGLHPDNGLTMYGVCACFFETFIAPFYGISVKNCTWLPDSSSQRSPFNNSQFRTITEEQRDKIFEYVALSLSNRFGFNAPDGTVEA